MTEDNVQQALELSVIIPVLNEANSLVPLHSKLSQVLPTVASHYEIIFVDDGSTDASPAALEQLCGQDPHVRVIQFRRNFGKSAALAMGFSDARGNIVITMDADLQDEPEEIPRFLEALSQGYDLVSGWKYPRLDPPSKTLPSAIYNGTTRWLTGVPLHDFNCGFKAYRLSVVRELRIYGELHRYIPVLAHWRGFKVSEIKVRHHPRQYGQSKYGWERLSQGLFDLVTVLFLNRYTRRPLHLFGWLGLLIFLAGGLIELYLALLWFEGIRPIGTRPLFSVGILLLFMGIQLVSFGLLAELITQNMSSSSEQDYSIKRRLP
jgi:glycosyltransferase involved in cell wall biosynthesis